MDGRRAILVVSYFATARFDQTIRLENVRLNVRNLRDKFFIITVEPKTWTLTQPFFRLSFFCTARFSFLSSSCVKIKFFEKKKCAHTGSPSTSLNFREKLRLFFGAFNGRLVGIWCVRMRNASLVIKKVKSSSLEFEISGFRWSAVLAKNSLIDVAILEAQKINNFRHWSMYPSRRERLYD